MRVLFLTSFFLTSFASLGDEPINVPVEKLGDGFELIGKLRAPLGTLVSVAGVVVEGEFKGYEGGMNLRAQRIQGRYHQEDIQIVLEPFNNSEWGGEDMDGKSNLPQLEVGETYEMEGYETGGFVGIPGEVLQRMKDIPQTTGHYFRHHFAVTKAKRIAPISYAPWMFSGEKALFNGIAKSVEGDSVLVGKDWMVVIKRGEKWAGDIEGKKIESYGLYNPDATWKDHANFAQKQFDLVDGWWRLVELADQIGRKVTLRGMARSLNGEWWFHYRGTDLYVEGMDKLPGWTVENHWRPMQVEGTLERTCLPRLDQISLKPDRDLADYFIVREPSWKPLPALLGPERAFPPKAKK